MVHEDDKELVLEQSELALSGKNVQPLNTELFIEMDQSVGLKIVLS